MSNLETELYSFSYLPLKIHSPVTIITVDLGWHFKKLSLDTAEDKGSSMLQQVMKAAYLNKF